jgi:hypothetical protein
MTKEDEPTQTSTLQQKIIHVDMDALYASVEQRDNPDFRASPVAVGWSRERAWLRESVFFEQTRGL